MYLNGAECRAVTQLQDSKMSDKQTEKTIQLDTPSSVVKLKSPKLCCVNHSPVRCAVHACRPLWIWM